MSFSHRLHHKQITEYIVKCRLRCAAAITHSTRAFNVNVKHLLPVDASIYSCKYNCQ